MVPDVNDVLRVILASWFDGQYGLNIRYYAVTAIGGDGLTEFALANALKTEFGPLYQPMLTDNALFLGVSVRNLTRTPAAAAVTSSGGSLTGTSGEEALPTQVSGIITLRSALAGRANRGRLYIPFPSEDDNDAETVRPTAAYIANATALANALALDFQPIIGADSVTMVPIIKPGGPTDRVPIISAIAREAWATQRRRGDYGARNPQTIPQ